MIFLEIYLWIGWALVGADLYFRWKFQAEDAEWWYVILAVVLWPWELYDAFRLH